MNAVAMLHNINKHLVCFEYNGSYRFSFRSVSAIPMWIDNMIYEHLSKKVSFKKHTSMTIMEVETETEMNIVKDFLIKMFVPGKY